MQRETSPHESITAAAGEAAGQPDPTVRWFYLFAGLHLLTWTLLPILTYGHPPLDMTEMIFWGREWQLGYYKHPPLPPWIAAGAVEIFGHYWVLYAIAQIANLVSIWAAWRMAREVLPPWPALAAAVLLEACHYFNLTTLDINHTIITRPFWSLSVLLLYWAIVRGQGRYWVGLAVCLALGMMSKYYLAVLVFAMCLLPLFAVEARRALKSPWPYVTTLLALVCFAPHLYWIYDSGFASIRYVMQRSSEGELSPWRYAVNPWLFLGSQLPACLPLVLLATPLVGWRWRLRPCVSERDRFARKYLLVVVLGPIALYLAASAATGAFLRPMWGGPLFTYFAVLLLSLFEARPEPAAAQKSMRYALATGVVLFGVALLRPMLLPYTANVATRTQFPGPDLAVAVRERWQARFAGTPPIVAGQWWPAASASYYLGTRPTVYGELSSFCSPWTSDEELLEQGGVVLWLIGDDRDPPLPRKWQQRFPTLIREKPIEVRYLTGADIPPARVGIAIIPPQTALAAEPSQNVQR